MQLPFVINNASYKAVSFSINMNPNKHQPKYDLTLSDTSILKNN